ncbi:MAG: SDR family NAD(P)-dependent oxidoreductase [Gammaproteobacteria bacterium]|nr:SDR family NAD(P)-dependent oxidoreductase [Gammaproteobacteria bacterium]
MNRAAVALITGAGSGLGRALAHAFAASGYRVACTDRDGAAVQRTLSELPTAGGFAAVLDVTQEADFQRVTEDLRRRYGGVDVLINNAGVATAGTVIDAPVEQWRWVLDINLLGCVRGCRAVAPLMVEAGRGHIVNISSFAGIANPPAMASYNAAKAAVISLSETLRFELAPHGVGVSVACPSFFKTNLLVTSQRDAPGDVGNAAPQMTHIVERLMETASLSAADIAAAVLKAVRERHFLVLPQAEDRRRALIKRLSPELYFGIARKATERFLSRR